MTNPKKVYEYISNYDTHAIQPKKDNVYWEREGLAENLLFEFISSWFQNWMKKHGKPLAKKNLEDAEYQKLDIDKKNGSIKKDGKLIDRKDNKYVCYKLESIENLIGAIYSIGTDRRNFKVEYFIESSASDEDKRVRVKLSTNPAHYAKPQQNNQDIWNDVLNFPDQYDIIIDKLKQNNTKIDAPTVKQFIRKGIINRDNYISAFLVATYICESDRNWVQFLISLLDLGILGKTTLPKKETPSIENRIEQFKNAWKNQWSWGPGKNPDGKNDIKKDSKVAKRWCLKRIIDLTQISTESAPLKKIFWPGYFYVLEKGYPYGDILHFNREIKDRLEELMKEALRNIEPKKDEKSHD